MHLHRLFFTLLIAATTGGNVQSQPAGIAGRQQLTLADPTIFLWENKYYAFGTAGNNSNNGIPVYESGDLLHWKAINTNGGFALKKGDAFGTKGFWAPQVFAYKGMFYMAYTANENIAIATATQPFGPFTQQTKLPLPAIVKQIDPYVFMDDDGRKYLYHVRLIHGNRIFGAALKDDFSGIADSTLTECISATEPWENAGDSSWPVTEGPSVIKQAGKYYLFYSANDFRNPGYAVGMATSDHPLGPWVKFSANPILSKKQTGHNGTGHGDLFKSADGKWHYVFHVHQSGTQVGPRKTMMINVTSLNDGFVFDDATVAPLILE
jgi:xylan 1,4-beta-xylosidase